MACRGDERLVMKRILFVLHLPPPLHGASMMGSFLRDSKLLEASFDRRFINLATSADLHEIGKMSLRKVWLFFSILRDIRHIAHEWKPDLVYLTPTSRFPAFIKDYLVVALCKKLGMRLLFHFHNTGVSLAGKAYQKWMYRRFFRDSRAILLSERLYPDIAAYLSRNHVYICPDGIPDAFQGDVPVRTVHIPVRILFLSNLLVAKGIYVFLDACALLQSRGVAFCADIVGGETAEVGRDLVLKAISDRRLNGVAYLGRLVGDEKRDVLKAADILAFPSLDEAFGLVLLEAMQAGLPVVASRVGGIPDIIEDGENGFLVEPGNASALADRLAVLVSDSVRRAGMGEKGRKKYEEQFALPVFIQGMQRILSEAVL